MIKKIYILLFFVLLSIPVFSQDSDLQELKDRLLTTSNDTTRVNILNRLSEKLFASEPILAAEYSIEAKTLAAQLEYTEGEVVALKYLGLAKYFSAEYGDAYRNWEAALVLYEELDDKQGIANIYSNLGAVYSQQGGDDVKGLDYFFQALEIAEEIGDTLREITVLNNIGWIYTKKITTENLALENYLRALELSEIFGYKEGVGSTSINIGEIYFRRGDNSSALEYFEKSLRVYQEMRSLNRTSAYIYLGRIYTDLGQYDVATNYQEEALDIAEKAGAKLEIIKSLLALAETNDRAGNISRALQQNDRALSLSNDLGLAEEKMQALGNQAALYHRLENYEAAYNFLNQVLALKDTIYSSDDQKQLNELRVRFELENLLKAKEKAELDRELQSLRVSRQRFVIFVMVLGFAVTIFLIILMIRNIRQKRKANAILEEQNILISGQKQEITDSIRYASRIQNAVLTPQADLNRILPDHFILYRPRDIVSGDFYWITEINQRVFCVVADCTGHGVPGAFMSMLGVAFLNEIISRNPMIQANEMLNELRKHVIDSLHQRGTAHGTQDGMDLAAIIIEKDLSRLQYAGANNPLIFFKNGELIEYKADKMPIGIHHNARHTFTNHVIEYRRNDIIYAFSDGFPDQFGGPNGKKFMIKNFKLTLQKLHDKSMQDQKTELQKILDDWMSDVKQIDDIIVMGIRL